MLSVILPTYNERKNIDRLIERIEHSLASVPHELVFVDDSSDGTDVAIAENAQRRPHIRLIRRAARAGLATAAVEGICQAQGELVCVLDADLQHPPEVLALLLEALERTEADLVVASRNIAGGSHGALTRMRSMASRAATLLARTLLSRARLVSDPMSGFFVVRKEVVEGVSLRPLGYKILLEILVRGRLARVCEVPYDFQARGAGQSKLTLRQQWEYLLHLLRLVTVRPDDLRFARFCLVGASGALMNMGVLWGLTSHGTYYLYAGMAAIATATTWNFLLNDALTWGDLRSPSLGVKASRYLQYWTVTGVASVIHVVVLFLLTSAGLPYLASNLAGIATAAVWNFRTNGRWTWKPSRPGIKRAVYGTRPSSAAEIIKPSGVS